MMSGPPGKTHKKKLIQAKLSFTSHSSSSRSQASGSSSATRGKGSKRKFDTVSEGASKRFNMDQKKREDHKDNEKRELAAAAAEKRKKNSESESNGTLSSFANQNNGATEPGVCSNALRSEQQAGPSTAEDLIIETQNYELNDTNDSDLQDSQNSGRIPHDKPPASDGSRHWKGKPLDELNTTTPERPHLQKLESSDHHIVFVKTPFQFQKRGLALPHPSSYQDKWDNYHVRMPCSDRNEYPAENGHSTQKRWDMIKRALRDNIAGSYELEEAILKYNQRYENKWRFTSLHYFINKDLDKEDRTDFFSAILPEMVFLALKLPDLCTKPIPLLKQGVTKQLTMSQEQIACLLANAFFCTFPRRNSKAPKAEYSTYPDINFNSLFQGQPSPKKLNKLRCIFHYFKRVVREMPTGLMTFSRQVLPKNSSIDWWGDMSDLTNLHISSAGTIEDDGKGMLQVDFANKYLGGGVLGHGCVQEEIRFLICPELIVSRLFTEFLDDGESLIMTGCEQYSKYDGYADNFKWTDDCRDDTQRDDWGRRCTEIVAIDALVFRGEYKRQFKNESVLRELNKAFCGFKTSKGTEVDRPAVCTGNWGCGAFGGDKELKSLIQLMASSRAKRDMCYFTFGDKELVENLHQIHVLLQRNERSVGYVMGLIGRYNREVVSHSHGRPLRSLFEFIHEYEEGEPLRRAYSNSYLGSDDDSNEARDHCDDQAKKSPDYRAVTP